jgi:sugar/nucleoside kinase (ribokinase family)
VVVDLETSSRAHGADLQAVLRRTDIVFCNAGGLEMASGTPDVLDGARSLLEMGVELVVVTLGGKGAQAVSAGEIVVSPAFQVPVVDTTGAGDCFHAACLFGILAGWPLERSLQFASAAAACKVQHLGPRAGLPTRREVEMFLKENATG